MLFRKSNSAWRSETKVGLLLVLVLLGAFGFMVWQKWDRAQQQAEKGPTTIRNRSLQIDEGKSPKKKSKQAEAPKQAPEPNPFDESGRQGRAIRENFL